MDESTDTGRLEVLSVPRLGAAVAVLVGCLEGGEVDVTLRTEDDEEDVAARREEEEEREGEGREGEDPLLVAPPREKDLEVEESVRVLIGAEVATGRRTMGLVVVGAAGATS